MPRAKERKQKPKGDPPLVVPVLQKFLKTYQKHCLLSRTSLCPAIQRDLKNSIDRDQILRKVSGGHLSFSEIDSQGFRPQAQSPLSHQLWTAWQRHPQLCSRNTKGLLHSSAPTQPVHLLPTTARMCWREGNLEWVHKTLPNISFWSSSFSPSDSGHSELHPPPSSLSSHLFLPAHLIRPPGFSSPFFFQFLPNIPTHISVFRWGVSHNHSFKKFYVCVCVCLVVYMCTTHVQVQAEARWGHQMPWDWSCPLWVQEPNPSPVQKEQVLLTPAPRSSFCGAK